MNIRFLQNRVNNYIASTILFGIYRITSVYAYLDHTHTFGQKAARKIEKFIADNASKYGDDFLLGIPEA